MKKQRITQSILLGVAMMAGTFAGLAPAKDPVVNSAGLADFDATVTGVREVTAGNPLPGIHLDARINNRMTDIYVAPVSFLAEIGVGFSKGDEVHVVGSVTRSGNVDLVIAREIGTARTTIYLRDNDGEPFWPNPKTVD